MDNWKDDYIRVTGDQRFKLYGWTVADIRRAFKIMLCVGNNLDDLEKFVLNKTDCKNNIKNS